MTHFASAKEQYAALGVNVEDAIEVIVPSHTPPSLHFWQGDEAGGFAPPQKKPSCKNWLGATGSIALTSVPTLS